jgi:hypothetical protein
LIYTYQSSLFPKFIQLHLPGKYREQIAAKSSTLSAIMQKTKGTGVKLPKEYLKSNILRYISMIRSEISTHC